MRKWHVLAGGLLLLSLLSGCGTTKSFTATEQLLMSDAVDATVAKMDFSELSEKKVYLDVTYIKTLKSPLLIDSDYVISSLRQQMVGAGVLLVDNREDCEIIAEARMGALGMDGHSVVYGLPASNALSTATTALTGTSLLPAIPEISVARKEAKTGAAKLAVFAYDRETREPYWQSGLARSVSSARDTWFLGVGPFQRGTIYDGTRFAGDKVLANPDQARTQAENLAEYQSPHFYAGEQEKPDVVTASGVELGATDPSDVTTSEESSSEATGEQAASGEPTATTPPAEPAGS